MRDMNRYIRLLDKLTQADAFDLVAAIYNQPSDERVQALCLLAYRRINKMSDEQCMDIWWMLENTHRVAYQFAKRQTQGWMRHDMVMLYNHVDDKSIYLREREDKLTSAAQERRGMMHMRSII